MRGGIWQSGQGLVVDPDGNVYFSSGNGSYSLDDANTGNSFTKLTPALSLLDWFTPFNTDSLNAGDQDLGSAGLLGLPGTTYVVGGGKQGLLYVVDTNAMGHFGSNMTDNVVQEFQAVNGQIHAAPVYFNSPATGPAIYLWGSNGHLNSYHFNAASGLFNTTPFASSAMNAQSPGGFLSISANGAQSGIVWAATAYNANSEGGRITQGVVYAFDAATLHELWSDKMNDARDEIGDFAKFCAPTVANGKVYVPTFGPLGTSPGPTGSGQLVAYGLLPPPLAKPTTISGQVYLQGVMSGSLSQPITVTLTPTGAAGGSVITQTATTSANGLYTLTGIPAGPYTIGFKGSRWLRKDISVDTTGGNAIGVNVTLLGGDVNGDNQVTGVDLLLLKPAYNSVQGDARYRAAADFNCDGQITGADVLILKQNYNKTGDP